MKKRYYLALALVGAAVLFAGGGSAFCLVMTAVCTAASGVVVCG